MKRELIAMILAGGQGSRLYCLTQSEAKPSLPFGGKYRIIDFPLSNCANSGIDVVGVLTQYRPLVLNSYIGSGQAYDLDSSSGGVFILPPYMSAGEKGSWFTGTANAIFQNLDFISEFEAENVLILSGDHIYKMDYADMFDAHIKSGAACTISVIQVSMEDATRFGILSAGEDGFITEFEEKPAKPKSDLASMGIYIFNTEKLREYLIADDMDDNSSHDFGKNIIPTMLGAGEKLFPYRFEGYWRDVGTIVSLWDSNMDMLSADLIDLHDRKTPIFSRSPVAPPQYVGENASIVHSIVTEGCEIFGDVENSVLSYNSFIGEGAEVSYSVLMPKVKIMPGAKVKYSIIGEGSVIAEGAVVGSEPDGSEDWGLATVGPGLKIGKNVVIKPASMLYESVASMPEEDIK